MKPLLLLGKDGQVGWELERALAPLGPLCAMGRAACDVANADALRAAIRDVAPRLIVNAAAYTAVDRAEQESDLAFRVNAEAPRILAEEARRVGAPLVHYSTDYVFDGRQAEPYVETDATNPLSVYGRSKLEGEQGIRQAGGRALVLRTSWVFGETGGNFVRTILRLAQERDALRVVADQIGAPTPAALIADVTAHAIARLEREGWPSGMELYHLTAAQPVSWHAYAVEIVNAARAGGMDLRLTPAGIEAIPTEAYPLPAPRPRNSRLDCRRLEQAFALTMPDWRRYLARMLKRIQSP